MGGRSQPSFPAKVRGVRMAALEPIYTATNTTPAWQLDWVLTVFWRAAPFADDWLDELRAAVELDGIRLLGHQFVNADRSQFLVSTLPAVKPIEVVHRIKGRLQHFVRKRWPQAFRRNYDLHSIGSTRREKAEAYVASQLEHHGVSDTLRVRLIDLQLVAPEIDLSRPRFTAHGRFRCNLHLVCAHAQHASDQQSGKWDAIRQMIRNVASAKGHLLSRLGLLPDHVHLVLGFNPHESPLEVGLSYMNNIAFVYQMQPVLMPSCFLGTVGEYDLGAIAPTAWLPR